MDLLNMLYVVSRRALGDAGAVTLLERSEVLRSWMLPAMAAAAGEDEAEAKAFAMLESVRNLGRK